MSQVKILKYSDGELAYYMEHRQILEQKILTALTWLGNGLAEQGWKNVRDPSELVQFVIDEHYLMLVGDTLIAFTLAEPWFMSGLVISEEFIAPLTDTPAPIAQVVEALEAAGRSSGCVMLSLGTRANPRQQGLARLFRSTGASLSTIELVKEIV